MRLGRHDVLRLYELTEGWPAGAQLAAIALQRGVERDDFLTAFASSDRAVGDFLVTEVLACLPADVVEFLVETSVLDAFDADLCAAVSGVEEAAVVLDRLLAANLFVVPLDERAGWYRYHHLFGAFLRARLASLGASRLRAVHDRAVRALEQRGDVAGALQLAMAGGDIERGGEIVRAAIGRSMSMPQGADVAVQAVRLWLHEFGAGFVETEPAWVLELLIGLITLAGSDDVLAWLERIERAHPDADGELTALLHAAWAEHYLHRGQPVEAIRRLGLARDALGGVPPTRGLFPLLYVGSARAHIEAGQLDEAGAVLEHALTHPVGSPIADDVRHPGLAAFVVATAGELSRAAALAARAVRSAGELGLGGAELGRIFAGLAMVELHVERNEDEAALHAIEKVKRASEASHRVTVQAIVTLQQARAARMIDDPAGAAALLERTLLYYSEPDAALRLLLDEEVAAQALRFEPSTAARLISELDPARAGTQVLRTRLALLEHDDRAAAELLALMPAPTNRRAAVERHVLWALSLLERDVQVANGHLREAIASAQPEHLIRTIVQQGPDVYRLLKSFTPEHGQERYVQELLAVASRVVAPVRPKVATTLIESLSERELTVLRYLCSRLTYREIAAALYVSLNTLKSHVRSVYRKLGVASRAEAVEVGRSLRLI